MRVVLCAVCKVQCAMSGVRCAVCETMSDVQLAMCNVRCAMYAVHCAVCDVHCVACDVPFLFEKKRRRLRGERNQGRGGREQTGIGHAQMKRNCTSACDLLQNERGETKRKIGERVQMQEQAQEHKQAEDGNEGQ